MELGVREKDFLKELASIGAGSAATSLAKILSQKVRIDVPDIYVLNYSNLFNKLGDPNEKTMAILANINEPTGGLMLFILDIKSANIILEHVDINKINESDCKINEFEESTITEISNIIFNSYLSSLSLLTKQTIVSDKPFCILDMLGAILNYPINVMPNVIDKIVFMDSIFVIGDKKINGSLILISDYENLKEHMKAFGL